VKVKEIMTACVESVGAADFVTEAARKMADRNVGALAVYEGHTLVGVVTDRDILIRIVQRELDFTHAKVQDVMTWIADTCREDWDLEEAAQVMEKKKVRRLLVLDREGNLLGIVSVSDIAVKAHDEKLVEKVLESTTKRPAPAKR
jgi:predicted transcriptional regulator